MYPRAVQQIKFTKMPIRHRAGSSPIRSTGRQEGPEVFVTSPSLRSTADNRFRRGSLGAVEAVKARARRDTTTSSDMSSENEIDSETFQKRQIHFSNQDEVITPRNPQAEDKLDEEDELDPENTNRVNEQDDDSIAESVGSAMSSEFGESAGSGSLLDRMGITSGLDSSSSPIAVNKFPMTMDSQDTSPKKTKNSNGPALHALPPPRPISTVQPASLLTAALRSNKKTPANPVERFAPLSGDASISTPLYVKIYLPSSKQPDEPLDMPIVRETSDSENSGPVTVAEAIGLTLWKYVQKNVKPPLAGEKLSVNRWNLRMVEDGEVDYDFPPLSRNRPIIDFTSNNNRAAAMRGRSRSKPYDEFGLVEATQEEFEENEKLYPKYSTSSTIDDSEQGQNTPTPNNQNPQPNKPANTGRVNPILGQPFSSALNDSSLTPADMPAVPTTHATPRIGAIKTLKIRFIDLESSTQITSMNLSTDSYIAEILDSVCKKWGLDKGNYLLKVMGSNTIAPLDRTVEALGNITELDLVRRRFGAGPLTLTGSPGSSSPNAPLMIDNANNAPVKKSKKNGGRMLHPLAQQHDVVGGYYRRYNVIRKQSMSFTASSQRVIAFDNDYLHIMPSESGKTLFETTTKTSSISFSDVVGSKVSRRHPKSFRLVVLRGNDATQQKRYDFEAKNALEAAEIVDEIKKNMSHYRV